MESLQQKYYEKYAHTQLKTIRDFINTIDWSDRLIGIKGSRGVGKTTLLLQYLKKNFKPDHKTLYVSLDNLYFTEHKLYHLADEFYKKGGELLVIDEVHRYPEWAVEIKNIYDDLPDLKIIFTGSSLLHLHRAKADLSRRAVMYEMPGLSLREFISFETKKDQPQFPLTEILDHHIEIAADITGQYKPLEYYSKYIRHGYYPFYLENINTFHQRLGEILITVLEIDIPQFESIQVSNIIYLKKLLKIISRSVPFKPNMKSVSERTGISLNTLKTYLSYLNDARVLSMLMVEEKGMGNLGKPEKLYLDNPNLIYNLSENDAEAGNIRETFFFNQTSVNHEVHASKAVDFTIDSQYHFEIGGKSKSKKQIKNLESSYVVRDNSAIGAGNIIPLWLFGFLY
ncbi:MAG: ATP-binding protein [Bacteroidales bacterium]